MSENVSNIVTRISNLDGAAPDPYDHQISLVDATEPENQDVPRSSSPSPSWRKLAKRATKSSVKDHLARGKYAKGQEDRYSSQAGSSVAEGSGSKPASIRPETGESAEGTNTVDFAHSQPVDRRLKIAQKRRKESKYVKEQVHEIDILYENQRGSFFCGIPLYSHSSLMPYDPSPWVNRDFKESPVNITNAQVPDPSWEWAWKSWYVDMSDDVDEEGWQYSFAFGPKFAWHGTHPWFHSFVRRRRWLRKRVKKEPEPGRGKPGSMGAAHYLTGDYFTIHSQRDQSPVSAVDGPGKPARPSSFISYPSTTDVDEPPEDIKDIASLLKALRFATIDREKIDLVKKFVTQGGEELVYLRDHVSDVMSFFVFQNSRRQLLSYLKDTANEARQHRQKHDDEKRPEGEVESRRINHLLAAVDAADAQIGELEFWSDRKHVLKTHDNASLATRAIATIFDEPTPKLKTADDPVEEIKGISEKADISYDSYPPVFSPARQTSIEGKEEEKKEEDKGKGKAIEHDSEDDRVEGNATPRLGRDEVLILNQD
ncbi:uncharacterized protein Z518_04771 [Rhinocladiella mackenziei CBS 650.93]|uniref:Peroxin/Ferlin domain-containing protein n=1 Tax=Rhinocladiella mackenziei CBS 650.93 TaxID=1442369 RepID=A0A0D2JCF9_9EURO|nr:uncharacterized protein Z518_04771 [Rhinocladiella mackenziei CBS 650.93]KIX06795.1 hypothetical protein Z518_04771 [Rhinocladiella mackenziei CBS 650.93]